MIRVNNLSKKFLVPREKRSQLKDHFVNLFARVRYEKFLVLQGVSFSVNDGEWLGVVGKNGSGKSTLLKILAGIYTPDSGDVKISGNIAPFLELGVGFEPELSARDNVFLNGLLLGIPRQTIEQKLTKIVDFAEVTDFMDQKLKNFSSGMKVRLAFAIAMYAPADIFLVDEIFSVGDYAFRRKSMDAFKTKLNRKTMMFVSHDLTQLEELCKKVIWLDGGRIRKIGASTDVISEYKQYMSQQ